MFDPLTAFYALLGGVGLVGADAYFSSSTLHLQTMVSPSYVESGYDPRLVEALFLAELGEITDARSIVSSPHILSSNDKPLSEALAEAVGLSHALEAAKSAVGSGHPSIMLSILSDNNSGKEAPRLVVAGETADKRKISFSIPLGGRTVDDVLEEAAFETMKEIDPYVTALHVFELAEAEKRSPNDAISLINQAISYHSRNETDPARAKLENLMGLALLLSNDTEQAKYWFNKAGRSDTSFSIATLNLGYVAAVEGDCVQAIALVAPLTTPTYWIIPADGFLFYPASNLLGYCSAQLKDFDAASNYFAAAADSKPDGTSVYYYWARSLRDQKKTDQANAMMNLASKNISRMDNIPEIAMLFFWLPESGSKSIQRRQRVLPALEMGVEG